MRNQDGRQRWLTIGLVGGLVILGSMFVLWPAGGPEDGAASEEKQTAAPSNQGGGVSEDSGAASDPSADASATRAEVDPGDSISNEAGSVPVRGRVLGPDRRPVAGALLTVGCLLGESREIKSGADGSFSVLVVPPADRADPVSAVARHAVGVGSQSAYLREGKLELDLGAIVLRSVHGLRVRVMQDGTPVAAALVTLETPDRNVRLFSAVTDVIGEVFFEAAPERNLVVRAQKDAASGTTRAVPPGDQEVTLALAPDRDYELRVSDAEDAAPIGGALVACQQQFWMPAGGDSAFNFDGDYVRVRPDPARSTRTDEQGIAWIRGVGARDLLQLVVTAEGYPEPSEEVELRDDPVVQVRMTRKAGRTVRWPVVVGELAPPPQGTELEIRFVSGMVSPDEIHTAPGPALMQRGAIVLPGVEGVAHFLATAPDGAIAKLYCAEPESEGDPVTFRRPRSIEVTVRDAAGALVKGARVTARNQGNNELQAPVATNGNGVGVISGLYGGLASVSVAAPGDPGRGPVCGTIDLEQGDGRLEARLRSTARVRLRFQLDGVPGLPSSYRVSARGGCTVEAEDPVRAEVRVSAPVEDGFSGSITFGVRAEGFLDGRAEAFLSPGGGEAVADILLRRFGSLLVHVLRDPQASNTSIGRPARSGAWAKA